MPSVLRLLSYFPHSILLCSKIQSIKENQVRPIESDACQLAQRARATQTHRDRERAHRPVFVRLVVNCGTIYCLRGTCWHGDRFEPSRAEPSRVFTVRPHRTAPGATVSCTRNSIREPCRSTFNPFQSTPKHSSLPLSHIPHQAVPPSGHLLRGLSALLAAHFASNEDCAHALK